MQKLKITKINSGYFWVPPRIQSAGTMPQNTQQCQWPQSEDAEQTVFSVVYTKIPCHNKYHIYLIIAGNILVKSSEHDHGYHAR
jgi:hypothetical protein